MLVVVVFVDSLFAVVVVWLVVVVVFVGSLCCVVSVLVVDVLSLFALLFVFTS